MDPITLRSIERIVAVIIGGLAIYLGYRLFLAIPEQNASEGKFQLPGGISIYLARVGPGAFFALFGALVVAISFYRAITYQENGAPAGERPRPAAQAVASRSYTGFGESSADTLQTARMQAASDLKFLNGTLPQWFRRDLGLEQRTDLSLHLARLKLAVLASVWGPDWHDFAQFKDWVESGAAEPAPSAFAVPARLYRRGEL